MFIYIISTSYPDEEFPTKNIFVYEQAKELARRGHKIVVLHVKKLATKRIWESIDSGIHVIDDGFALRFVVVQKTILASKLRWLNKCLYLRSANALFEEALVETGKPDAIYAHFSCFAGLAASRLSKKHNIPLVTLEHYGGLLSANISNTFKNAIEETIEQSRFFLCVSNGLKQSLTSKVNTNKEILVLGNMIDRSFHYVAPKKKNSFVFLSIGNLYKEKGFELLISSFCNVFRNNDKVELRIGGNGPERTSLEKMIQRAGRTHQIKMLGKLKREETIREYIDCDCFVLASNHETFGMVYREALITGRPIITTDHGGFSGSDWHNEYGIKIPVGNGKALEEALLAMYENLKCYDLKEISKICESDCSADYIGDKIENLLMQAVI